MGMLSGKALRRLQHTLPGVALLRRLLVIALAVWGCSSEEVPESDRVLQERADFLETALARQEASVLAPGVLRVQLAFGAAADLDLYVTDPAQESVYFGNTPSRSGGALEEDLRCDAPAPRIETIRYPDPPPGRYRVGVDYPEACVSRERPVAMVLRIDHRGSSDLHRQLIEPRHFQPIVLEFEIEEPE